MGSKKGLSLSLLMLANICMLAHAVIPHHHHDRLPVALSVVQHEGTADCTAHKHLHCDDELPADDGCDREECFLELGFTGAEERQHGESCPCCTLRPAIVVAICSDIPEADVANAATIGPKPPVPGFDYDYLTRSLGLRAPPAC